MNLKLNRPIACIDLETTGTNISHDRIVEISIVKVFPDGKKEIKTRRINPCIPIPVMASEIHGIFDEDVKNEPTFKELAKGIQLFLENCDLCGFNSNKFDIPMLTEEFLRVGIDINFRERKMVDVQQIFFKKEPRNLSAAYKYYCGKDLENAHSAEADTVATLEILEAQVEHYKDLQNDIEFLHNYTNFDDTIDYARRLKMVNYIPVFNFGKYKDKSVAEVFKKDPDYYDWVMKTDFTMDTKNIISKILNDIKS